MKIVVCGMGYVGATVIACMLRKGATVVGIDISDEKVAAAAEGQSPVKEPGIAEIFARGHAEQRLFSASTLGHHLVDADMVLACVGTPSRGDGSLDLSHVAAVSKEIGEAIMQRPAARPPIACVFRSTMLPGSMEGVVLPGLSAAAGEPPGLRYEPVYNPEFMRESTAIADFLDPPKIVIGERFPGASGELLGMYEGIDAPTFRVPYAVAELVKYIDNYFHATKVAFANEIGRLATAAQVNPQQVVTIFLSDTKLNISPSYLRPGGAFGGSCLPKDVRALSEFAHRQAVEVPLLDRVIASNTAHKAFLAKLVMDKAPKGSRILQLGLTFKDDTDDLRESPLVDLAVTLLEAGYDLHLFEPDLNRAKLVGQNLAFMEKHFHRLFELLVTDFAAAAKAADVIVLGKAMPGFTDEIPPGKPLLHLHRLHHA